MLCRWQTARPQLTAEQQTGTLDFAASNGVTDDASTSEAASDGAKGVVPKATATWVPGAGALHCMPPSHFVLRAAAARSLLPALQQASPHRRQARQRLGCQTPTARWACTALGEQTASQLHLRGCAASPHTLQAAVSAGRGRASLADAMCAWQTTDAASGLLDPAIPVPEAERQAPADVPDRRPDPDATDLKVLTKHRRQRSWDCLPGGRLLTWAETPPQGPSRSILPAWSAGASRAVVRRARTLPQASQSPWQSGQAPPSQWPLSHPSPLVVRYRPSLLQQHNPGCLKQCSVLLPALPSMSSPSTASLAHHQAESMCAGSCSSQPSQP